jgi:multiple sugar transport system substrate-binding protein
MKRALLPIVAMMASHALAAPIEITMWRHDTGDAEMVASRNMVDRFNRAQAQWKVVVETIPQGTYTESITAASLVGHLPCVMTIDQPAVPNFAWAGNIRPLDRLLPASVVEPLLPGGRGTYQGRLYSVGQFDVVLALFARRSALKAEGVRVATIEQPYSARELYDILSKVKRSGHYRYPLDLNGKATGEWFS